MDIIPAIDLKDGYCVRLAQGDFESATIYNADPVKQAQQFADAGAQWVHVVDLDGARQGDIRQFDVVARLAREVPFKWQVGGGIRSAEMIEKLLAVGVTRVVIGSLAVKEPEKVRNWLARFGPDRIVLALDVALKPDGDPELLTEGWQAGSGKSLWDVLQFYAACGLKTVLCTDVSRDGMLTGTNHALYKTMQERWPDLALLASGGVSGLADLMKLARLGVAGAIVGKAIYEGRVDLAAAVRQVMHAG